MTRHKNLLIVSLLFALILVACGLGDEEEVFDEPLAVPTEAPAPTEPPLDTPLPAPTDTPEPVVEEPTSPAQFVIANASGVDICGVLFAESSATDWEGDLLEESLVAGGEMVFRDIAPGSYDLLAYDCGENDVDEQIGVELGVQSLLWSIGVGIEALDTAPVAATGAPIEEESVAEQPSPAGSTSQDDLRFIDFGTFPDGVAELAFTINPGDVSVHISVLTDDPADFVTLTEITGPGGQSLYSLDFESFETNSEMFPVVIEDTGAVGFIMPAAPQFPLAEGDYRVVFQTETSAITKAQGVIKSGDAGATQAIDFNVWLVTTDETLQDDAALAEMENAMRANVNNILNPHNMQLGTIHFIPASAADRAQYAQYVNADELSPLCFAMAAAVGTERSVNIALVDALLDADGNDDGTAGISTGLPGSVFLPESPRSCVAAAWQAYETYPEHAANWFHEGSHFMGLPHTTESDGLSFDIFLDTPECPASQYDSNGDGEVDDFECDVAGGAKNYMFYSGVPEFAPFEMSADQAWTLRRHPWFYPVTP